MSRWNDNFSASQGQVIRNSLGALLVWCQTANRSTPRGIRLDGIAFFNQRSPSFYLYINIYYTIILWKGNPIMTFFRRVNWIDVKRIYASGTTDRWKGVNKVQMEIFSKTNYSFSSRRYYIGSISPPNVRAGVLKLSALRPRHE